MSILLVFPILISFSILVYLENRALQRIFITDGNKRKINFVYSDYGIIHYDITDNTIKYETETDFVDQIIYDNEKLEGSEPPKYFEDKIISHPVIFRVEKYKNIQKKYTFDYEEGGTQR